jgi:hypothetical protein
VEQENRRRVFWAGLSVKDEKSIYLDRAIKLDISWVVPFLAIEKQLK